jgi:hypothetical protein
MNYTIGDLGVGAAIGYGASREPWTEPHGLVLRLVPRAAPEQALQAARGGGGGPGGTPVLAGRKLARLVGRDVSDQQAAKKIGLVVHRTLGMSYGMATAALARRGVSPLVAGYAAFVRG